MEYNRNNQTNISNNSSSIHQTTPSSIANHETEDDNDTLLSPPSPNSNQSSSIIHLANVISAKYGNTDFIESDANFCSSTNPSSCTSALINSHNQALQHNQIIPFNNNMETSNITSPEAVAAAAEIIQSQSQAQGSQGQPQSHQDQESHLQGHVVVKAEQLSTSLIQSPDIYQSPDINSSSKKRKKAMNGASVGGNTGTGASGGATGGAKQHQLPMFLTS